MNVLFGVFQVFQFRCILLWLHSDCCIKSQAAEEQSDSVIFAVQLL